MPVTDGIGILTEMHLHTEGHLHLTKKNNETSVHYQREPSPVTPFLCRLGSGRNSLQAVPSQKHGLHDLLRLPHAGLRLFHLRPLPASKRGSLVHGCVDGLSHTEPSLPGQGVQPGVQRNYIPHRQSGRYPREHLSGYSRRTYPRNAPEVPAPHVQGQQRLQGIHGSDSPTGLRRNKGRTEAHSGAVLRYVRRRK